MKNIWIVGNVLRDVYLALDEEGNQFETGANGEKWLDVGFNGRSYGFYRQTTVYGGAATTEGMLRKFGLETTVTGDWRKKAGSDGDCRYILCCGEQVAYLAPRQHQHAQWEMPTGAVDWILVDRSAELTPKLMQQINTLLDMSTQTQLAVFVPRKASPAVLELAEQAELVIAETGSWMSEAGTNEAKTGEAGTNEAGAQVAETGAKLVGRIEADYIEFNGERVNWRSGQINKLTHLTAHNIITGCLLGAVATGRGDGLQLAQLAVERAQLGQIPSLSELERAKTQEAERKRAMAAVAAAMVAPGKGILAADESGGSTHAHFAALDIVDDEPHRRDYRDLLLTTPHLGDFVNGVILFDETTKQKAHNGENFVDYLTKCKIIPGVKVDQGLADLPGTNEKYTRGLDGLRERLHGYYRAGLRFAKWRAAFNIAEGCPSERAVTENCRILAEYAQACQDENIVPIVEPELVHAGNYSLGQCQTTTGWILDHLFAALRERGVLLPACILKVNMVLAGSEWPEQSAPEEVGVATAQTLCEHVPEELAGVVFLSGGQGVEQSTENLQAVTNQGPFPWPVTFSFARALQTPALETWRGDNSKIAEAQEKFTARLVANTEALKKRE